MGKKVMLHPILVNGKTVCYATDKKTSHLISQMFYHMRGFFVDDFTEPSIGVLFEREAEINED